MTDPIVSPDGQTIGSREGEVLRDANGNRSGDIIGNVIRDNAGNEVGRLTSAGDTTRYYDTQGGQTGVSRQSGSADTTGSIPTGQSPLYRQRPTRRSAPPRPSLAQILVEYRGSRSSPRRRNNSPFLVRVVGTLIGLVVLLNVASVVFSLIGCALGVPLLSRVFSHAKSRHYLQVNCIVALSIAVLSIVLKALHLLSDGFTLIPLGIFYALVLVVSLLQGILSRRYPQYVEGSGYGLLNLRALFEPAPLSHRFDLLHDALVALVLALVFVGINHTPSSQAALNVITGVLLVVGYAWYCQRRFAGLRLQLAVPFTAAAAATFTPQVSTAPVAFATLSTPPPSIVPGSATDLVQRGQRLLDAGDLTGARALARQAYQLDKTNPDALVLVSRLLTDPAQQMSYVKKALQANPLHAGALACYRELTASTVTAQPVPAEVAALMQQAQAHLTAGDLPGATALAQQAYQLDQANPAVLVLVSRVIPGSQRQQELVTRALQTDPLNGDALNRYRELTGGVEPSHSVSPSAAPPSSAPLPTAVVPPPSSGRFSPRLLLLAVGIAGLLVVAGVVFGLTRPNNDTPDGVARQFIHAVLTGDDTTVINTLAADSRTRVTVFCSPPLVACIARNIPLTAGSTDLDNQLVSQTGPLAVAQVRVQPPYAPTTLCVQVQMRDENGWKVVNTINQPTPCALTLVALSATPLPLMPTPTLEASTLSSRPLPVTPKPPGLFSAPLSRSTLTASSQTIAPTVGSGHDLIAYSFGNGSDLELWIVHADGSQPKAIAKGQDMVFPGFAWSPDGKQIAFIGARSQQLGVYVYHPDMDYYDTVALLGNEQRLTSYNIGWSHDGKRLVYMAIDGLHIATPDGKSTALVLPLSSSTFHYSPAWSPDDQQIAFIDNDDLFVVNADGTALKPVTHGKALAVVAGGSDPSRVRALGNLVSWTPAGQIMYTVPRLDGSVYTVNPDGSGARLFLSQPYVLSWSPDRTQLAGFLISGNLAQLGIYLLDPNGVNAPRMLVGNSPQPPSGPASVPSAPAWQP